jgi:hypothetical protein
MNDLSAGRLPNNEAAASASAASVQQWQQLRQALETQGRGLERLAWLLVSAGVPGDSVEVKSLQDAAALAAALPMIEQFSH